MLGLPHTSQAGSVGDAVDSVELNVDKNERQGEHSLSVLVTRTNALPANAFQLHADARCDWPTALVTGDRASQHTDRWLQRLDGP